MSESNCLAIGAIILTVVIGYLYLTASHRYSDEITGRCMTQEMYKIQSFNECLLSPSKN